MARATSKTTEAPDVKICMNLTFGGGNMKFILEIDLIVVKYLFQFGLFRYYTQLSDKVCHFVQHFNKPELCDLYVTF